MFPLDLQDQLLSLRHTPRGKALPLLLLVRLAKHIELEIMPLLRRHGLPGKLIRRNPYLVVRPQEIRNREAIPGLILRDRNDAVHRRSELAARKEAQRVADVDDGAAGPRDDVEPALVPWCQDLQARLQGQEEGEGAEVRVFVVALGLAGGLLEIAEEGQGAARGSRGVVACGKEVLEGRIRGCWQ